MLKNVIENYDDLNEFTKEELIKIVIALDKVADEAKTTINKLVECNNKLLSELEMNDQTIVKKQNWLGY